MIVCCCDFCNRPLSWELVETGFGPEEVVKHFHTHEVNTRKLFPILCESCATKIDQVVVLAKDEWLKQIDISARNSRLNAARRLVLNSKG